MNLSLFVLSLSIIDELSLILSINFITNLTLCLNFKISWHTLRSLNFFEFVIQVAILSGLRSSIFIISTRTFHLTFMLPTLTAIAYSNIITFIITHFFYLYFPFTLSISLRSRVILRNTTRFTFYTLKLFLWSIRISNSSHLKSIIILIFAFSLNNHWLSWIFYSIVFISRKWLMDLFRQRLSQYWRTFIHYFYFIIKSWWSHWSTYIFKLFI